RDSQAVNQLNDSGLPPLYTAALHRNREAVDYLLGHGAALDIFACAYLGKASAAENLLRENPALVKAVTSDGRTALHYAALAGHFDVADVLLRHHADVNAVDNRGETPLMEACHAGPWKSAPHEGLVQLLLDHDARIDLFQAAALGRTDWIAS